MNGSAGDLGQGYHFKVGNPNTSNNIPQMRSAGYQAPFRAGGNQVPYYLGVRGNMNTEPTCCGSGIYSTFKKVIKKHRQI